MGTHSGAATVHHCGLWPAEMPVGLVALTAKASPTFNTPGVADFLLGGPRAHITAEVVRLAFGGRKLPSGDSPAKPLGRVLIPHTGCFADAFGDSVNGRSSAVAGTATVLWNGEMNRPLLPHCQSPASSPPPQEP
jgi:hypothetical protein